MAAERARFCEECGHPLLDPPPFDPRLGYEPGCRECYNEPELADLIIARRTRTRRDQKTPT